MSREKNLFDQYATFLRNKISTTGILLSPEKLGYVVGERLIEGYYIALLESTSSDRYIIVENIDKPFVKELKTTLNNDGYVVFKRKDLADIIPRGLYKNLINRGLTMTKERGMCINDKQCCWHRLVACLYYNCLGKEVHHINKDILSNEIMNLIPLPNDKHKIIDKDDRNGYNFSIAIQQQKIKKLNSKRNTLANNDAIIKQVLLLKAQGLKPRTIVKMMSSKICKSKVYQMLKMFYYAKEFLYKLEYREAEMFIDFYGKRWMSWRKIVKFDVLQNK